MAGKMTVSQKLLRLLFVLKMNLHSQWGVDWVEVEALVEAVV